jgi:hypothetical protein
VLSGNPCQDIIGKDGLAVKKLIGSLLLAGLVTVVAVGCGESGSTKSTKTSTAPGTTASTATTAHK